MSASFLAFKNASNPSNCICCTLKQKFLNLHKNLKLVEKRGGEKKNVIILWLSPFMGTMTTDGACGEEMLQCGHGCVCCL